MRFNTQLVPGRLIQRYKRYLADVELESGGSVTAACGNPGAMLGLTTPGARVWLQPKTTGKLAYNWELIEVDFGSGKTLVGVNTNNPNPVTHEALQAGAISELADYAAIRREVKYGINSRIDFLLEDAALGRCYLEVKNCHMMRQPELAEFPDCVTERGAKHLRELANEASAGHRAVMLFVIQMEAGAFTLAADVDPVYANTFAMASAAGMQTLAYTCRVSNQGITLDQRVPIRI